MSFRQTYNKSVAAGHGTLIGNWMEEEVLRNVTGHTHLESSRNLDTFTRVMGDRAYPVSETFVTSAGRRTHPPKAASGNSVDNAASAENKLNNSNDLNGLNSINVRKAAERVEQLRLFAAQTGLLRQPALAAAASALAQQQLQTLREEKEAEAQAAAKRSAADSVSSADYKFRVPLDGSELSADEAASRYFREQINSRPAEHSELVSRWTELASASSSSVMKTPHTGRLLFGKDSFFSIPTHLASKGLSKDMEALEILEQSLRRGSQTPATAPTGPLPALQAFKDRLRNAILTSQGSLGFLVLRAALRELCDERGLVSIAELENILCEKFGVCHATIPRDNLRSALNILSTIDKEMARAADVVDFIWAPLPGCRASILDALKRKVSEDKNVFGVGSCAATLRLTRPRPQLRLASIPEFLLPFLKINKMNHFDHLHATGLGKPVESEGPMTDDAVPLWRLLEALIDLSQGVGEDGVFLATVTDIAKAEGLTL